MRVLFSSVVGAIAALVIVAINVDAQSAQYYVLDGFGGVHAGGGAAAIAPATPYFGFDVAQDIAYLPRSGSRSGGVMAYWSLTASAACTQGGALLSSSPNPRPPYFRLRHRPSHHFSQRPDPRRGKRRRPLDVPEHHFILLHRASFFHDRGSGRRFSAVHCVDERQLHQRWRNGDDAGERGRRLHGR